MSVRNVLGASMAMVLLSAAQTMNGTMPFPNTTMTTNTTMASNITCGPGLSTCYVSDPTRSEPPWAGSSGAYPQCYSMTNYVCAFNFLCPVGTVKVPGQYACTDANSRFTNVTMPMNSTNMFDVVVNAPSVGDVDGTGAELFAIDLSINALSMAANDIIPFSPLYQDMASSTFGPGPNAAFPGLVVLQNTTSMALGGPNTNLAGIFQLNGVAMRNGLNNYNSVWQAGAPMFGVGPSELVVYYVSGMAGMNATYQPTEGLVSNVVRVPFEISNRTENAVPDGQTCYNGDVYTPPANTSMATTVAVPYPMNGDIVGMNGSGWVMSVAVTASSSMFNNLLSASNDYSAGYTNPTAPTFAPGPNPYIPGLVVTLNTTMMMSGTPFVGAATNLAGLFQSNAARVVNCDSQIQMYASWYVGMPIAGHGPVLATVYVVNGTAPAAVTASTPMDAISPVGLVEITTS